MWAVLTIIFFALRILPGDPASIVLGASATPEMLQGQRELMGLDEPLYVQYIRYLGQVARGDWGDSLHYREPVMELLIERIPATVELAVSAIALAVLVAFPLGVIAALRANSTTDRLISSFSLVGQSVPNFWLGIVLIIIFSRNLGWFPSYGRGTTLHLVLPVITLSGELIGLITRLVRSGMLDALGADYTRTARAKGAGMSRVIQHHAFKNMLAPVVTVMGVQLGTLLAGTVVLETVFAWPGAGRLIVTALNNRDYPVVQAAVTMMALIIVVLNLLVDFAYAFLDPRVRVS